MTSLPQNEHLSASATATSATTVSGTGKGASVLVLPILLALSFSHMLNDVIQSLLPAVYPILKDSYALSFTQIGIITFVFQLTASLLQPLVGIYTDRRPQPYSLPFGMFATLCGLLTLAYAEHFWSILLAAALIGIGSSVFHPESSRMARVASGGRPGFAQSVFQIGGNSGQALGPVLAALVILPFGQSSLAWFAVLALVGMVVLTAVGRWYQTRHLGPRRAASQMAEASTLPHGVVLRSVAVLVALIFSKYFYLAAINSYYTFYLIEKFGLSTSDAQMHLFLFLGAAAVGTLAGGPLGDAFGRKRVIWASILGLLPFTLALPYANLLETEILSVIIGFTIASAFPAIIVYAQELMPGRTGMIAGLFFGLAFGMGGLGAAVFGLVADARGVEYVYSIASFLPALGILTVLLPKIAKDR